MSSNTDEDCDPFTIALRRYCSTNLTLELAKMFNGDRTKMWEDNFHLEDPFSANDAVDRLEKINRSVAEGCSSSACTSTTQLQAKKSKTKHRRSALNITENESSDEDSGVLPRKRPSTRNKKAKDTASVATTSKKSKRGGAGNKNSESTESASATNQQNVHHVETIDIESKEYSKHLASKARVVTCIDLVSDDEETKIKKKIIKKKEYDSLNSSLEEENPEISLKLRWINTYERIPHRKFQKFLDLLQFLANREKADVKEIILVLNNKIIEPNDTPDSLNLKIYDFITGRIIPGGLGPAPKFPKDPNEIEIKVQIEGRKRRILFSLKKTQTFKILYIKCAEELKTPYADIKLSFDGDPLEMNETPNGLEFDGGEIIDCRVLKPQF